MEEIAPTVPYPTEGKLTGLWTAAEIVQAEAAGARVQVTHAYVHAGGDTVFADWHDAIMEGREMQGYAGQLAKATGNALWGQFVIDDRKRLQVQRWNGTYKALAVQASGGHQKRAWDIGEIVCGTVRAKLYEALAACSGDVICCHTDGLWIRDSELVSDWLGLRDGVPLGSSVLGMTDWRIKSDAAELHVLDQQKYRYRTRRGRTFQTVFSGVPAARADETFQRLWAAHA